MYNIPIVPLELYSNETQISISETSEVIYSSPGVHKTEDTEMT